MTIFQHPFIKYFRLERKLTKKKIKLSDLAVAMELHFMQGKFNIDDEFKLGYLLSKNEYTHLTMWAINKMLKF